VSEEAVLLEVLEGTRAVPGALTFDGKHHTFGIRGDPSGATETRANGDHLAIRGDFNSPATKEIVRLVRTAEAEGDPDIAIGIVLGSEGEFVSFGVAPVVSEGMELVGRAIAIAVLDTGDFTKLRGSEGAIFPREPEDFILPAGEEFVGGIGRSFESPGDHVDIAPPGSDGQFLIGKDFKTAGVHRHLGRNGDVDQWIVFRFRFGGAPHCAEVFGKGKCRQAEQAQGQRFEDRVYHRYSR
jgi:hypothetical protein